MSTALIAGIETGGTKILAQIRERDGGAVIAEGKWPTGTAGDAAAQLLTFLSERRGEGKLVAAGLAAFGPLVVDPASPNCGQMQATTKPGWNGSNLRLALEQGLNIPVAVDSDVNAAAIAEQRLGAGERLYQIAYVTVGTGIGAGLAIDGHSLKGALHPEAGHLPVSRRPDDALPSLCPFHPNCAEGLAAGPAVRRRLGGEGELADRPDVIDALTDYLAQLAATLVLAWSPHRIVWGGGVIRAAPIVGIIEEKLRGTLAGYGVGPAAGRPGFCAPAALENAGLEGALLMAGARSLR